MNSARGLFAVAAGLGGGFHDGFGEGGVGVDGGDDFFLGGFEAFGEDDLYDEYHE